jgi:Fe-S oxidoreductase
MAQEYCYPFIRKCLSDYYEMTWRCAKCGYCKNVFPSDTEHGRFGRQCPSGERFKFEPYFASGRSELARRLIEGEQGLTERLRHILYTCTTCGACEEWCQATQWRYPLKLEMEMRKHFVRHGGELLPQHKRIIENIRKSSNRLNRNNRDRRGWLGDLEPQEGRPSDVVYFVGCRSSFNRTEIALNAHALLTRKLGIPLFFLADERCCGRPLLDIGAEDAAVELMRHNVAQIASSGAQTVIFSCAECFSTFNNIEKFGILKKFKALHISQFLIPAVKESNVVLRAQKARAVFQDPCYLGRHQGVYDEPRALLSSIPGLELVEMPRNRKNAWCCGAGGGVQEAFPQYSQWIARERFEEIRQVQADLIITACPGCKENLWSSARAAGMVIKDLMEVVNEAAEG